MALNPALRIGSQLLETIALHEPHLTAVGRRQRLIELLSDVDLPCGSEFTERFAHQLSGGQQQRVVLALAFACRPSLMVLDEPTTSLDVISQSTVLRTVRRLCRNHAVAAVYVSHDLALAKQLVDRIMVVYGGRIVESAPCEDLFAQPAHPYTRALLAAVPDVACRRPLQPIPGQPAPPGSRPAGCPYSPRCSRRGRACGHSAPPAITLSEGHEVACANPYVSSSPSLVEAVSAIGESRANSGVPLLDIRGISASYGPNQVLFDVGFRIERGECVALVGESGSGKTTLARALAGLGDAGRGEVSYSGLRRS
jgi:peptide/nickel transport system ATP-binding protein